MPKRLLSVIVGILIVVALFFVFNSYIYNEKQEETSIEPYRATLTGTYTCLPYQGEATPSEECVYAIKLDDGSYYAIDFKLSSQEITPVYPEDKIQATGTVTPIERLSTDYWQQYDVAGIFSVTDSVEVIDQK